MILFILFLHVEYTMREQRNLLVDCIKGGAIILVVLGHCIQFMGPSSYNFFDNFRFKSIYSFHMPLFMAVSGYLFSVTIKKGICVRT